MDSTNKSKPLHHHPIPKYSIKPLPQYNKLFYNQKGWTGADGSYSVKLSDDITLWLYSDTWVSNITEDKQRKNATIINNSIALQHGKDPLTSSVKFFWGDTKNGKPTAFITPADDIGWFWLFNGIVIENKLYLFLMQTTQTDNKSVFGFKFIQTWLAQIENPHDNPKKWRITQHKLPWNKSPDDKLFFGSALVKEGDFVYIYGYKEDKKQGRSMIIARTPANRITDFKQWRFLSNGHWQTNMDNISNLFNGIATEYSVSYQSSIKQYVAIYSENGMSKKILARFSPTPIGPWSSPYKLYECPEYDWHQNYFCYAAKAHPTISKEHDLIVTYVCNSTDFWQVAQDTRIYWPRFLNIKFSKN
ncbi:MAG: DUF4185 domain-containing protein [Nanoarchaeota archaeon]|nr:DUF4185 domain-containing protein [Nanoarchaeota archaeon]